MCRLRSADFVGADRKIIKKTISSADAFTCFLHQNYLLFYSEINDMVHFNENYSHADMFLKEWGVAGKMNVLEYGCILAAMPGPPFSVTSGLLRCRE